MNDVKDVMGKLSKANRLMADLIDIAMADDTISDDEKRMLFSINENLAQYARLIIETVSDGKVDDVEKKSLRKLENKILTEADVIAKADSSISDDERAILIQLITTITSL